ncbi:MAG: N-acetylglucosamine kinase [Flavobacteriaceae bacterium]|nr:N-acetylglucosamine kinase [Flavobacteriaceae bacterium]|tara:strand:+ start:2800 stop:3654 length:855 start_codon:yes stop_codon:yes gene_type:complete
MILIVDSGSTKTDWIAINEKGDKLFETQTLGLNPQVLGKYILQERIVNNYELYKFRKEVNQIYFYGAGCGTEPPRVLIKTVFSDIFKNCSKFSVKEDTYAAIYSTAKPNTKSIVCILGTGSNCTYFDGNDIEQKVISLGYILMDDASGNYFGRQLLRDYYFNRIPKGTADKFNKEFVLDAETIKDNLYKQPNPNTYLAKFAKFLIENNDSKYGKSLIKRGFNLFIERQILQFTDACEVPIHFVGSISFYLKDQLIECLKNYNLTAGKIIRKPIEGLLKYHQENL